MSRAIKLKNNDYIDSTGVVHNKEPLNNLLNNKIIHDSGSNSNGSWIRYEDGTMICAGNFAFTGKTFSAVGNVYYRIMPGITFPVEFTELYSVVASVTMSNIGSCNVNAPTNTEIGAFHIMSSVATSRSGRIYWQAIGKWK